MPHAQSSAAEDRRRDLRDLDLSLADLYKEKSALKKRLKLLEDLEEVILEERKNIVNLHLIENKEDLLADEREIVVSDFIKICNEHGKKRFEGDKEEYSLEAISPDVIKALKECDEYDITQEFVSSILFIFSLFGNEIDLDNIKNLDPRYPEDRDMIERIMAYLNKETDFAIQTCREMLPKKEQKPFFDEKIRKIQKALIDFEEIKRKYDKYVAQQKWEMKMYLDMDHARAIEENDARKTPIPGEDQEAA